MVEGELGSTEVSSLIAKSREVESANTRSGKAEVARAIDSRFIAGAEWNPKVEKVRNAPVEKV